MPRTDRELAGRLQVVRDELTAGGRRTPTIAELAKAAGVDEDRAARALHALDAGRRPVEAGGDDAPGPGGGRTGADDTEAAEARVLLEAGWSLLDERERRMLELRYREDRSQSEIARELGLSQAHVSRLLRAALERLRASVDPAAAAQADQDRTTAGDDPAGAGSDGRSGKLLLRVPRSLHGDIAAAARREGVSLNAYIVATLAGSVAGGPDAQATAAARSRDRARRLLIVNAVVIAVAALAGVALLLLALLGS